MKEKIKYIIIFIAGILISVVISVSAATVITAGEVSYTSNSNTTVQTGLDNLYTKANGLANRVTTLETKKFDIISSFGEYKTSGQTLNLSASVANYRYIVVRSGYNADSNGIGLVWIPVSLITSDYTNTYQVNDYINGSWTHITIKFLSATQVKITGISGSSTAIRGIYGVN